MASPDQQSVGGHLLEAYHALRVALNAHTEPMRFGYTASMRRGKAIADAQRHLVAAAVALDEPSARG